MLCIAINHLHQGIYEIMSQKNFKNVKNISIISLCTSIFRFYNIIVT